MNRKGTLGVRQLKDNVRLKILYDSSYFTVNECLLDFRSKEVKETKEVWTTAYGLLYCIQGRLYISTFCKDALRFGKGLVKYAYIHGSYIRWNLRCYLQSGKENKICNAILSPQVEFVMQSCTWIKHRFFVSVIHQRILLLLGLTQYFKTRFF